MISWLVGVVVCTALLMGCNGGQKGNSGEDGGAGPGDGGPRDR